MAGPGQLGIEPEGSWGRGPRGICRRGSIPQRSTGRLLRIPPPLFSFSRSSLSLSRSPSSPPLPRPPSLLLPCPSPLPLSLPSPSPYPVPAPQPAAWPWAQQAAAWPWAQQAAAQPVRSNPSPSRPPLPPPPHPPHAHPTRPFAPAHAGLAARTGGAAHWPRGGGVAMGSAWRSSGGDRTLMYAHVISQVWGSDAVQGSVTACAGPPPSPLH